ncbi:hypothetical protein [Azospirillum argentinense]
MLQSAVASASASFQSTPPRRRRPAWFRHGWPIRGFNPRLRAGGDRSRTTSWRRAGRFNPRLRAGGDATTVPPVTTEAVSIHASAQEATRIKAGAKIALEVSIHASAQEATRPQLQQAVDAFVSIHASAQEATRSPAPDVRWQGGFNPRLRAGGDTGRDGAQRRALVSIHASAQEATAAWCRPNAGPGRFNPRLRAGGDSVVRRRDGQSRSFQSTPPRRRRPDWVGIVLDDPDVSIHASAQEATHGHAGQPRLGLVSIHASAQEATVPEGHTPSRLRVSIHASAQEATPASSALSAKVLFQSTPPRRRRPQVSTSCCCPPRFNPRLRAGGDAVDLQVERALGVSIHASAQEATLLSAHQSSPCPAFQSTPPRRRRPPPA